MKRIRSTAFVLGMLCLSHAATINISGVVKDRAGRPFQGVQLSLINSGWASTSDAQGIWSLTGASGARNLAIRKNQIRWAGGNLEIELARPSRVQIDLFDLQGASIGEVLDMHLDQGQHQIPFRTPHVAGAIAYRASIGGELITGLALIGNSRGTIQASFQPRAAARQEVARDTLRLSWKGAWLADISVPLDTSGVVIKVDTVNTPAWSSIPFGTLRDSRDGQVYRTVRIGGQTWMAQNLNFSVDSSWLYAGPLETAGSTEILDENPNGGELFGRYYSWAALLNLPDSCNSTLCAVPDTCRTKRCPASAFPARRGICPVGWHVPSDTEWTILQSTLEKDPRVVANGDGAALKSTGLWPTDASIKALDLFGFRALPSGRREDEGEFKSAGIGATWWTASEGASGSSKYFNVDGGLNSTRHFRQSKTYGFAARCLKDAD